MFLYLALEVWSWRVEERKQGLLDLQPAIRSNPLRKREKTSVKEIEMSGLMN